MTETNHHNQLLNRLNDHSARVGIIGLGYVGLPLALLFEEAGLRVVGFDVDPKKPAALQRGESYFQHIGAERVARAFARGRIEATTEFDRLGECDAVVICVPTPLGLHREPDLSYVRVTADEVAKRLRPGQLVVLESTTYPGTTREELLPRFEARGLRCGQDFFLAFSPEREDPGNEHYSTRSIPKVVGGIDPPSQEVAVALYAAALEKVVPVSSPEVAEAAKLLENIFRAVNIALANEMKVVLDRMGIDVWEVIEAAKTKPFGFMPFYPGPGLGGHCIPLDPFYLTWKAAEHGVWARFIELAGEVNTSMPEYVVEKTAHALNSQGRALKGARVLVLGLSYKANIDDDRESPSFEIIEMLQARGAEVAYCDPFIPRARKGRHHDLGLASVPLTAAEFGRHDVLVVSTAHALFRDPALYSGVKLVVDSRNLMATIGLGPGRGGPTVVRA
jgi:UDP-N-acetyl-D-glucosamine dehydrogenase